MTRPSRDSIIARYNFALDQFQLDAIDALDAGNSVLVAAPTGSGKTLIAEYAIEAARQQNQRAFYTAPIKALSNQKFNDLVGHYGKNDVGLLTGDNSINTNALNRNNILDNNHRPLQGQRQQQGAGGA